MIKSAIILAGGKGERLRPLTEDRPKVMVELNSKPILLWQIEWLKSFGITHFILTVSYKHEVIQDYFGSGEKFGIEIDYSIEETPLGRGGAIKQGFQYLGSDETEVVVTNGDIITKLNLEKMVEAHQNSNALVTDLLVPFISPWGIARVDEENHILGYEEKPKLPYWINGGIYIFDHSILDLLPSQGDHELETFPKIPKEKFLGFKDEGFWKAVDLVKDKTEAEEFLKSGKDRFY